MDDSRISMLLQGATIVYMVGICGAGMTALAQVLQGWGKRVQGSDTEEKFPTDEVLERLGITAIHGFSPNNLPFVVDLAIRSSAYSLDHPEVEALISRGVPVIEYAEALEAILNGKRVIAIAGTHGKTTTTAMVGLLLEEAGLDPTVIVGARVGQWAANARVGRSDWMVIEADEYQNKFHRYRPEILILTSIDWDHPDYFVDAQSYREAFRQVAQAIPPNGTVIAYGDDVDVLEVVQEIQARTITYGRRHHRNVRIVEESRQSRGQTFWVVDEGKGRLGPFDLELWGAHNVSNAAAVVSLAIRLGIPLESVRRALRSFAGAERRMQEVGTMTNGAVVVDDYGHHPVEVSVTLRALKDRYPDRNVCVVFQAHTYTRTRALLSGFAHAFGEAYRVVITDIFGSVREQHGGVTPQDLVEAIRPFTNIVEYVAWPELEKTIRQRATPDDCWVMMGAGDGWKLARALVGKRKATETNSILDPLAVIVPRSQIEENVPLSRYTTFRIGGPARWLVRVKSADEFARVAEWVSLQKIPLLLLSGGANMLVSDKGFSGVVIKSEDRSFVIEGCRVTAGSGVPLLYLAQKTAQAGLTGAEFCAAIPGSLGGAIRGNAGAFGGEMKDIVQCITIWDETRRRDFNTTECAFSYRTSIIKEHNKNSQIPWIVLAAVLQLSIDETHQAGERIREYLSKKFSSQSLDQPSAGCIFKNIPIIEHFWDDDIHRRWKESVPATMLEKREIPAGWLIDRAELKGRRIGGAQVSEKHGNFILNTGRATAEDVMILASIIKQKIRTLFGVQLKEEIEVVGLI